MPIFEAQVRKTNLSPQQIKEAEKALFGPAPVENAGFPVDDQKIRTIDLNNPPTEPYRYQEYPRMMYLHGDGAQFLIVQNDAQRQVAEGRGYQSDIVVPDQPEAEQYAPDYVDDGGDDAEDDENFDEQIAGISGPIPGEHEKAPAKKKN